MNTEITFGAWIKRRRRQLDLTQKELANLAGCGLGTLRKIERGTRRPSKELAAFIGVALDVPAEQIPAFVAFARSDPDMEAAPLPDFAQEQITPPQPSIPQPATAVEAQKTRHNLPLQPTPFIGRSNEIAALNEFLVNPDSRLITILGPGGMGKTRLALACAEQLVSPSTSPLFRDGLFFVDLAPLSDPNHIIPTMAKALQFPLQDATEDQRSAQEQLLDYLREKQLLLIMDNLEHLMTSSDASHSGLAMASSVKLLTDILQSAPAVQIIVTSRERLRLRQEQVYPIHGLEFPDGATIEEEAENAAVQLFLQTAHRNQPDFELQDSADLDHLARICRLVAGMPLAIELAAAWVDMLSLQEIATDLTSQDGQGLDLLETDYHDMPARHQSVRTTIDYSWQKLNGKEQKVFAQLAIFRGSFTRRAGQQITKASLPLLARLVKKSLLQFDRQRKRYQVHELLCQYGLEKLAEDKEAETALRDRHAAYYCHAMADRTDDLKGGRQKEALSEIDADIDNARAAWDWAVERRQIDSLAQAGFIICRFYKWFGRLQEYRDVVETALLQLDASSIDPKQRLLVIDLLHYQAEQAPTPKTMDESLERVEKHLAELERADIECRPQQAKQTLLTGALHERLGEYEHAVDSYKQSINLYHELDRQWEKSHALLSLGELNASKGHVDDAEKNIKRSLNIAQVLNDRATICLAYQSLGFVANVRGDGEMLHYYTDKSIAIARELDLRYMIASLLVDLGTVKMAFAHYAEAEQLHQESLTLLLDMGYRRNAALAMWGLGMDKLGARKVYESLQWTRKGLKLSQEVGDFRNVTFCFITLSLIELIAGRNAAAQAYAQKALQNAPENYLDAMAADLIALGWSQLVREEYAAAERSFYKVLQEQIGLSKWVLLPIAYLLMKQDTLPITLEEAWQLIGHYEHSAIGRMPIFNEFTARFRPKELWALPQEQIEAAKESGRILDLDSIYAELIPKLAALGWDGDEQPTESPTASPPEIPPLPAPDERFVQEELIAVGGMGEVYRGHDTSSGQRVAIKRLKPELAASDPDLLARFAREGEALRRLNHPNIVQVLATIEDEKAPAIIMEFVPGGDLRSLLDTQIPIPLRQVLIISLELADALSRAHHLGIIHRDLKPANVLLAEDGTPRLTDFGIARLDQRQTRLTQQGTMMGSPAYMSPEACQGEEIDQRSDIWSFGVLLYELLTAVNPFDKPNISATLIAILNQALPDITKLRSDVPLPLAELLQQVLVKDRTQRLDSARQVAATLERILQETA